MNFKGVIVVASLVGLVGAASSAQADGYIAPSVGVNFGGDAGKVLVDAAHDRSKVVYGVAAGMMTKGIFGVEEDFGYSPSFFGSGGNVDSTRVITLMTNAIIGIPVGGQKGPGVRPYGTIGLGLISRNVKGTSLLPGFSANDFGYDVGAGVMGYFANNIGLRVGVQYFRNFEHTGANAIGIDAGDFNFFRGSVGVLFRF